mgnify:CR=1 FL=1
MSRYKICPECGGRIDTTQKAKPHVCDKEALLQRQSVSKVTMLPVDRPGIVYLPRARKSRRKPK